jgi:hypothetical protein
MTIYRVVFIANFQPITAFGFTVSIGTSPGAPDSINSEFKDVWLK